MPKEPEPGYIRMNPDDGHSVSFPDTSRGTDSPVEFAAHAFGVPTWGVEAANAIIDAATNVVGFEDGGLVGDPDITHDADDPEAAQRVIDALRDKQQPTSRRRTSSQAARRRLQQQAQPERRQVKVMLPKPPPGRTGHYKITWK